MKRLSNYVLFAGLIMAAVSMSVGLAYRFTTLELSVVEKSNTFTMYVVGALLVLAAAGYKIFKEHK